MNHVDPTHGKQSRSSIHHDDISSIVDELKSKRGDTYSQLLALGRANAKQYKELVAGFLNSPEDPMLARLALQILCRYWGFSEEYSGNVLEFVNGVSWDDDHDVRIMAISCSDELIDYVKHRDLLRAVFDISLDENDSPVARQAAYCAMAISCGISVVDLPSPVRFNLNSDMDPIVLESIRSRIKDYGNPVS